jgi:hypothetical protein
MAFSIVGGAVWITTRIWSIIIRSPFSNITCQIEDPIRALVVGIAPDFCSITHAVVEI